MADKKYLRFTITHLKMSSARIASAPASASDKMTNISLFIPYVFENYDKEYIANAFKRVGEVSHIDLVEKIDHKDNFYHSVYIHFHQWHKTEFAKKFYQDVMDPSTKTQLHHDGKWFWIVLPNFTKKQVPGQRKEIINLTPSVEEAPAPAMAPKEETKWTTPVVPLSNKKTFANIARGYEPDPAPVPAPVKKQAPAPAPTQAPVVEAPPQSIKLPYIPYKEAELTQEELGEMAEMVEESEQFLEENDMNFVTVDERYLRCLEEENMHLNARVKALEFIVLGKGNGNM